MINKEKLYSTVFYLIVLLIGIAVIIGMIYSYEELSQLIGEILILSGCFTVFIRAYKLENYLLLLDKKPTLTYFQHFKGMSMLTFYKKIIVKKNSAIFLLPKLIFKKSELETKRMHINLLTYLSYILIICGIIIGNIRQ